jgi:hypothetical protein
MDRSGIRRDLPELRDQFVRIRGSFIVETYTPVATIETAVSRCFRLGLAMVRECALMRSGNVWHRRGLGARSMLLSTKSASLVRRCLSGSPETMVSNHLSARNALTTKVGFTRISLQPHHQSINWSIDCQPDRFANTAEHFHQCIDGELGRFLVHHVGHTRA